MDIEFEDEFAKPFLEPFDNEVIMSIEANSSNNEKHSASDIDMNIISISSDNNSQIHSISSPYIVLQPQKQENNIFQIESSNNHSPAVSSSNSLKRKYVKRSYARFVEKNSNAFNETLSAQLTPLPLYSSLRLQLEYILFGGDCLYFLTERPSQGMTLNLQKSNSNIAQNRSDHLQFYKDIVTITTQENFFEVRLANRLSGMTDFRNFITLINNIMSQYSGESHIEKLLEFQNYLDRCTTIISRIITQYPTPEDLLDLQQRRLKHIKDLAKHTVASNYNTNSDFLIIGLSQIDFKQKLPTLGNLCFNKAIISLIGSDFDSLQAYFMRQGMREFFDFKTCMLIQQLHMETLTNRSNERSQQPFTIVTLDNYSIPCSIHIETLFNEMPDSLKYNRSGDYEDPFDIHEGCFIARLVIPDEMIREITLLRENAKQAAQNEIDEFKRIEDISYSMQSQILVEKYYPSDYKKMMLEDQQSIEYREIQEQKEKEAIAVQALRCRYKPIPQA